MAANSEQPYSEREITLSDAKEHGLNEQEFEMICGYLGRKPTATELGIYSGLWSEHCSYKNSILQLKRLPTESPLALSKAGEENAGALDIGDGLAVVFKIESHNHPTAIEPYQGAATGVGGIMRDIFTMGARPICSLNSLRFGPPDQPRNHYLFHRSVKGIGDYGNSLGIAVSGGEIFFDETFSRNCLINAMTVGVVRHDAMATATAAGIGNPVFIVGATTGRDGIHGASFASQDLTAESESRRSAVQVGDPFMEKLLLEATLELIASDTIVGIQDMGAAGLSCSSSEMSAKGEVGMELNLDLVPLREEGMNAYEIMLSESQERMLVVVKKGNEQIVKDIFEKWDLHAVEIGHVTDDGILRVRREGKLCAAIPANSLVLGGGAPRYERQTRRPVELDQLAKWHPDQADSGLAEPTDLRSELLQLLESANICSRRPVIEQYDTDVGLVRVIPPGGDGGLARVPGTSKGIAVSTDCNSRYVRLDPRRGAAQAVAESARNVAVTGARPIGITNCLNFANPYIPENYYMFAESISGMRDACEAFGIPVTGGNVSFYNESPDGPIFPTPTIGMVGLIDNIDHAIAPHIANPERFLLLVGDFRPTLGGSEYLHQKIGCAIGEIPELDLALEKRLCDLLVAIAPLKLVESAHDLSLGGLAVAIFRTAYNPHSRRITGVKLDEKAITELSEEAGEKLQQPLRRDQLWFGETNGSILLSVEQSKLAELSRHAATHNIDLRPIGVCNTTAKLDFGDFSVTADEAVAGYEGGLAGHFAAPKG